MAGGERDEVREPFERDGVAGVHESGHGVVQAEKSLTDGEIMAGVSDYRVTRLSAHIGDP